MLGGMSQSVSVQTSLASRLERAMREAGYNPRSLSLSAALGMTAVRDILDGRIASPRYATLSALARVLGVSVEWLMNGEAAESAAAPAKAAPAARDFPVYGAARGGSAGSMAVENTPIEHMARPDPLLTVAAAYGVYIVGESMSPAYEQGDIALVHPGQPPRRGTDVILTRADAHGTPEVLIKRLVGWTDDQWQVCQYNPAKEFELSRAEWRLETIVGRYNRR
jgi:SOS-response transcriptional repressor LexA